MDKEVEGILTQAEAARREKRKREDRGAKFRSEPEVKELIQSTQAQLKEIKSAVMDCAELFERAERLGLRKQLDCRMALEYFEMQSAKLHAIPQAIAWIENLTEADFQNHYANSYPWTDTVGVFISEFLTNQNGDSRGVAVGIRQKHALLEDWIRRNPRLVGAETVQTTIIPPPRTTPSRTLNNLDE
jgi:hypothetical protein